MELIVFAKNVRE